MAFDLVQYFAEQIKLQRPQLLKNYSAEERKQYLSDINALALGKLISLMREDENKIYHEISTQDHLYIQEVARHLTTSPDNKSLLNKMEMENSLTEMLSLQLNEIKQLDTTGSLGVSGVRELLLGQIEHLSGVADDWVWSTNSLTELKGSKPIVQEDISLEATMKEFNQMVNQQADQHTHQVQPESNEKIIVPTWARILEPVVALVILWVLYSAATQMFTN